MNKIDYNMFLVYNHIEKISDTLYLGKSENNKSCLLSFDSETDDFREIELSFCVDSFKDTEHNSYENNLYKLLTFKKNTLSTSTSIFGVLINKCTGEVKEAKGDIIDTYLQFEHNSYIQILTLKDSGSFLVGTNGKVYTQIEEKEAGTLSRNLDSLVVSLAVSNPAILNELDNPIEVKYNNKIYRSIRVRSGTKEPEKNSKINEVSIILYKGTIPLVLLNGILLGRFDINEPHYFRVFNRNGVKVTFHQFSRYAEISKQERLIDACALAMLTTTLLLYIIQFTSTNVSLVDSIKAMSPLSIICTLCAILSMIIARLTSLPVISWVMNTMLYWCDSTCE